jgi:hypothetical protein
MGETITIRTGAATEVIKVVEQGPQGPAGSNGANGQGVPVGGTTGQVLRKASGTNYDTEWATGGGGVSSWNDLTDKPATFAPSTHASSHLAGTPAAAASYTGIGDSETFSEEVTITANTAGTAGNSITLTFDGVDDVDTVLAAWNSANPSNQATLDSGDGGQIPEDGDSLQLSGGVAAIGGGSDPFANINQDLGTTDNVAFNKINVSDGIITGGGSSNQAAHPNELLAANGDTKPPLFLAGGSGGVEIWDNSQTPTYYGAFGLSIPGQSATQDFKFGTYNGSWVERFLVKFNGGVAITPTSQPASPVAGHIYYSSSANKFYGYNGTSWLELDAQGGGAVSIESTAADILSVSSGAISADDAGADRIVYWNNTSNKLTYGTPSDVGAAASSHTHSDATQSVAGFLSTADKTKIDGIASGANNYTHPNHTGDVTSAGDGATTIANNAVTNAKLAQVASSTLKGRATAATGNVEDLTASQVRTILNVADGAEVNVNADWNASSGDAQILNKPTLGTAAAAATTDFAAASHTHAASAITSGTLDVARLPVGTGSTQVAAGNHTHVLADVTGAAASGSITTSGLTQSTARLLGRTSASTGAIEEIQIGSGLSLSAGELSATSSGGISAVGASTADVLSVSGSDLVADDPNADRIVFWDDSEGKLRYLEAGSGLTISGTTMTATSTFDPASPAGIGTTAPNTGAFTSLTGAPAANTAAYAVTGYSLTGSNAQSVIDLAGTWNTTGTPSAFKLNVTDTASNASSLLMQLQTGGTNRLTVSKAGAVVSASTVTGTEIFCGANGSISGKNGFPVLYYQNVEAVAFLSNAGNGLLLKSDLCYGFGNGTPTGSSAYDVKMFRDAAATWALRDGTNNQEMRCYGTHTSSTNFQRMTIRSVKQTLSALSGASATTTGTFIPDGAVVVGVTTRVGTALTGATGYTIGDGTDADRWGDITGTAIGTTSDNANWTAGTIECFTAGGNVTLTANGSNFTAGAIEICVFYLAGQAD